MSKIIWRLPSDAATLTESSANADYPALHIQSTPLQPPWRTDNVSSGVEDLVMALGQAYSIGAMAILGHTIAADDVIKAQGHTADSWGSPDVDETVTYRAANILHYFAATNSKAYWRFLDTIDASSGGTFDIGRLFVGTVYDIGKGPKPGSLQWGAKDTGKTYSTLGGQVHADVGVTLKTMKCKLSGVPQTATDELDALITQMGNHTPFIFHPDPTGRPNEWIYGRLKSHKARKDAAFGTHWTWSFDMIEAK